MIWCRTLYSHMAKPRPGPKLPSCKGMPPVRYTAG